MLGNALKCSNDTILKTKQIPNITIWKERRREKKEVSKNLRTKVLLWGIGVPCTEPIQIKFKSSKVGKPFSLELGEIGKSAIKK